MIIYVSINWFLFLFIILQCAICFYLVYPFILYFICLFKGLKKDTGISSGYQADYAVIVTAYEQTDLIQSVVNSLLGVNYTNYLIYVVADNCDVSALLFSDPRVILLRPETTLASNVKSHFYAIDNFKRAHERLTIIDSDNLVCVEYLNELNKLFDQGFYAVQGVRKAKNLNTQYACLDEAGDIYYRFIDRKLLFEAGSSASLAGSGMAFTTAIYKACLADLQISGAGFDKILQYELLKRRLTIALAEKAIVYDEKTAKSDQLVKQRARWINTWFKFFVLGLKMNLTSLGKRNLNQFLFSLMLLRPPLFLLLMLCGIFCLLDIFIFPELLIGWIAGSGLFVFIFFNALNYFQADERIYKSLKNAPKFIYYQLLALLKANKANMLSVATKHEYQSKIEDIKP
ncbi:MAG: glycosyltransferase [Candidatus Pedobacter colombiensis]|uniref:Glycosyltransferase n=1 Tax=Candidatus Pedobacter colombiensis TaxID=3121371 RepID=A0AAJ5W9E9_9SPHI|nr:glycosyltransferase [Pedobacter sp.]WEK21203.1 MAG: glycosyltransferase [Pedobacter sp.]